MGCVLTRAQCAGTWSNILTMFSRLSIHAFIPPCSGASSDGSAMSSIFVKPWKDSPLGVWS